MKTRACSICGVEKPETTEYFYIRSGSQTFRRECKACRKNAKTRPNKKKPGVVWDYPRAKQLFLENGLTPLFDEFEGRVSATEKLTALNNKGYKVWISIDKLRVGKTPDSFSPFNPNAIENIQKFINDKNLGMIVLSKEYKNNVTGLEMLCPKGHAFKVRWSDFQIRQRCTKCYYSSGEGQIENWLATHDIEYKREYTFDELRGQSNQPLRYDFAIFENQDLKMLIEYDGELHFKPGRFSKSKEKNIKKLEITKQYDDVKNKFASQRKIKLVRIPYTKYHEIEDILATHL